MYTIYRFYAESRMIPWQQIPIEDFSPDTSQSLALVEINLKDFNSCPLSGEALANIGRIFACFQKHGIGMILRFVYDWEGRGIQYEPKELSLILTHMEQLEPLLREYAGTIYIMQGLFIGSWGEMHNTRYDSVRDFTTLAEKLLEVTAPETFLAVRCPNIWRGIFRTRYALSRKEAYQNCGQARFGLYNDAILGSETDMGTYGSIPREAASGCGDKLTRYDELAFQQKLCQFVPNGGEVLNPSSLNDLEPALQTLRTMRLSYLNCGYDEKVLDKWRGVRIETRRSVWKGKTGYDYVAAHLGYRFLVEKWEISEVRTVEKTFVMNIKISNTGFSPCYRPLQASLLFQSAESGSVLEYPLDTDPRMWMPGESVWVKAPLELSSFAEHRYNVGLKLLCPKMNREIRLANTPEIAGVQLVNPLGEVIL
jgi:hypothetical protein